MANKTIQSNSNIKYLIWGIVVIALAVFVITTKFVDKDILKVSYMNPDILAGQVINTSVLNNYYPSGLSNTVENKITTIIFDNIDIENPNYGFFAWLYCALTGGTYGSVGGISYCVHVNDIEDLSLESTINNENNWFSDLELKSKNNFDKEVRVKNIFIEEIEIILDEEDIDVTGIEFRKWLCGVFGGEWVTQTVSYGEVSATVTGCVWSSALDPLVDSDFSDQDFNFTVYSLGKKIDNSSISISIQRTKEDIYNFIIEIKNNTTNSLSELSITIPSLAMISFDSSVSDMQGVSINTKTNTIEIDTLPANSIVSLYSFVSEKEIIPLTEKSTEQTNEEIIETPRGIFHSIGLFFKRIKCKTEGTTYYSSFDEYPGTLGTWLGPNCY